MLQFRLGMDWLCRSTKQGCLSFAPARIRVGPNTCFSTATAACFCCGCLCCCLCCCCCLLLLRVTLLLPLLHCLLVLLGVLFFILTLLRKLYGGGCCRTEPSEKYGSACPLYANCVHTPLYIRVAAYGCIRSLSFSFKV